ncbi:(3R)-3-hydroxyacyl-CoA dehydrogenase isoform X2 [Nycticebus coucang]|uniref:(3R)-3-hydroxyacyl-CoA dehydrogenase isoform X2 n=1 Tax=Nycticebus coucang TaxID=9470 RepID=UPI00234DFD06|nr:(3R)-3-hydroxyacyl-CoA dehydrogenase isoform X2 [Nycticebus coucang]
MQSLFSLVVVVVGGVFPLSRPPNGKVWPRPCSARSACAGDHRWPKASRASIGPGFAFALPSLHSDWLDAEVPAFPQPAMATQLQLRLRSALALVTGAGSGIGRAVSARLAREGAAVAVCDLDGAAAQETVRLLGRPGSKEGAPGGNHAAFQADVSEARTARRLLEEVQACFSRPPSVVVSCAGITRDEFLLHMTEDDWDKVIAVNLKVGNMGQTNYAASKAGVIGLTQTAARELARHGIRCNAVLPGFIATPMTQKVPQKVLDKVTRMIPMGHLGDPEDVADVVTFLASEDSGYITGASVEVTGGLFM